ncbi:MurR/RpiR family transcriptional regulator [Anaerosalibacter bizertensis]|uniref:MurR/RpiR family transcriptional regulator n=1 Tax=Anaerosalibacter bizertensis TaxID=932217 RepID=UPI001C0EF3C9|nr:MurR/RpiR family transcriptional regulator [Anaerosalibacter bizertensis]MBU5294144.1 MurR/RpiR family transcriptional regulator [Anaerosalibacter bizertensis]
MDDNILLQIQNKYLSFSEKERMIANYIIKYSNTLRNININDLAKKTDTSNSTITRFCKKIGCESFIEMKMRLCASNSVENKLDTDDIFQKVYSYYNTTISGTNEILDKKVVMRFLEEIKNADRIFIYGLGSSGLTAFEMKYRLQRMGMLVDAITDPHIMVMTSSLLTEDDMVIGISNSGSTVEVIKGLEEAKNNKAFVLAITSFDDSPINKYADLSIITYNTKFVGEKNFINSQLSIIYLIDILSLLLLEDKRLSLHMGNTLKAVDKYKKRTNND